MTINISDFIDFCTKINSRDYLDNRVIMSQQFLDNLKRKSEDKKLYLGVFGEFSSGKSALINALLRVELLKEDILQGTTCTPTFIEYSETFDIEVAYSNGLKKIFSKTCNNKWLLNKIRNGSLQAADIQSGEIREFIDKYTCSQHTSYLPGSGEICEFMENYTATEEYSAQVDAVHIYLNNPILKNNLVIVDTPNSRDIEVAQQTIIKCDAVIVLTPAHAPCSDTLCSFIKNNLSELECPCIGIISEFDRVVDNIVDDYEDDIDEMNKALERLLGLTKQRLNEALGKPFTAILPLSAKLANSQKSITPASSDKYITLFSTFENTIQEKLINCQKEILSKKHYQLIKESVNLIERNLESSKAAIERQIKINPYYNISMFQRYLSQLEQDLNKLRQFKQECNPSNMNTMPVIYSNNNSNFQIIDPNVKSFVNFCGYLKDRDYWVNTEVSKRLPYNTQLLQNIQTLKEQNEDNNLYLGVIGEFSSGKSTLINAILHQNLLKKDVNPTTSTPTFIRYGDRFNIVIDYSSGKKVNFWDECKDADLFALRDSKTADINDKNGTIRQFISKYTANEDVSKGLDRVTIFLNNPFLKNGLVIVDTPGINAGNYKRHEDVTKETIKKYCDAVIIITKAKFPCEKTLCDFVNDCISGLEDRCIGVVSQIDEIGDCDDLDDDDDIDDIVKEQNLQLKTVQNRFDSMLKKSLSVVLPVSARYAEGKSKSLDNPKLLEHYKNMFSQFMETIHQRMVMGREKILAQSMHSSALKVIDLVKGTLLPLKNDIANKQSRLQNNQLSDVNSFVNGLWSIYEYNFRQVLSRYSIDDIYNNDVDSVRYAFEDDLDRCSTYNDIENVANNKLSFRCRCSQDNVNKKLENIQRLFSDWANNSCQDFQARFAAEFRNLSRDFQLSSTQVNAIAKTSLDIANLNINHNTENFVRGAGYFISGILGGVVGLGIFALIDNFFFDIESARFEAMEKIEPKIDEFCDKMWNYISNSEANIRNQSWNSALQNINGIRDRYAPTITEIINEEQYQINKLHRQELQLEEDLERLNQFKQSCSDKYL